MITSIEIVHRSSPADFLPKSLDQANRTVEIIFSTGSMVKRWNWDDGYYWEKLSMDPKAVILDRLNAGASLLNGHSQSAMDDRLGAVVPGSARVEAGKGICTVKISRNPEGERLMVDLRDGLGLPISVGYRIHEYEKKEGEEGALPIYTATRWEPLEVSAVPVPADFGAHARGEPETQYRTIPATFRLAGCAAGQSESTTMADDDAATMERSRADQILALSDRFGVPTRIARRAIAENKSIPEFREMMLDFRRKEEAKTEIFTVAPTGHETIAAPLAQQMADALLGRILPRHKVTIGRDFAGAPLSEMARHSLEQAGVGTRGMSNGQLIERASMHTTSDLPIMLDVVANRILRDAYDEQPSGLREAAKEQSAQDFRTRFSISLGLAGALTKVNEHGEFRRVSIKEGAEGYAMATYGGVFAVTRQALINENLGYFAEMPAHFGKLAARLEAEQLAKLLLGTQKLSDGVALYHANHGNLLTPAALSTAALAAARLAMRRQKGPTGEVINIAPKFLVVPPELELLGEQVLAAVNAEKVADTNPFHGRLSLIVENNLADPQAWYILADQGASGLEFAYLEGEKGVQLLTRVGFDVDGQEWKARLDFGCGWTDFRGAVKNAGVAP